MDTREAALAELEQVFTLIAREYQDRGQSLPKQLGVGELNRVR